jgi:hypothetical protein
VVGERFEMTAFDPSIRQPRVELRVNHAHFAKRDEWTAADCDDGSGERVSSGRSGSCCRI